MRKVSTLRANSRLSFRLACSSMQLLLPFSLFFVLGCKSRDQVFEEVACTSNDSYSGLIYRPCREFTFKAKYWDKEYNLISDQRIWMMATGGRWEYDEGQAELAIQYEYDDSSVERIKSFNLNKELNDRDWIRYETTGFAETSSSIWFHPFRANQYLFTEVAPFPMLAYSNLEVGKEWPMALNIGSGWGIWEDSRVESNYKVMGVVDLETDFGIIKECFHIKSVAYALFGVSHFDYWFNKELGIVKMLYRNYENQILQIELAEVKGD